MFVGVDIVDLKRFRRIIKESGSGFINHIFSQVEINDCNKKKNKSVYLAGKFACKEAVSKALNMGWEKGLDWKEIEIVSGSNGEFQVKLSGQSQKKAQNLGVKEINLSLSNCQEYAVGFAVAISGV